MCTYLMKRYIIWLVQQKRNVVSPGAITFLRGRPYLYNSHCIFIRKGGLIGAQSNSWTTTFSKPKNPFNAAAHLSCCTDLRSHLTMV